MAFHTGTSSPPTPRDCDAKWSSSNCSKTCGGGQRSEKYAIKAAAVGNGKACNFTNGTTRSFVCNTNACGLLAFLLFAYRIHCGYKHGTSFLLKLQRQARQPRVTATPNGSPKKLARKAAAQDNAARSTPFKPLPFEPAKYARQPTIPSEHCRVIL